MSRCSAGTAAAATSAIAHFLGIHAEQAMPILAALVAGWRSRVRWAALIGGTALYVAVTLAIFAQAVAGRPLLPL